jgi:hypothetical protein
MSTSAVTIGPAEEPFEPLDTGSGPRLISRVGVAAKAGAVVVVVACVFFSAWLEEPLHPDASRVTAAANAVAPDIFHRDIPLHPSRAGGEYCAPL